MNANTDTLPRWAREALRPQPELFSERVARRWTEIKCDVLPELPDCLSEKGKTYFFRFVFDEAVHGTVATPRKARNAVRLLDDIRKEMFDTAWQLVQLLREHADIYNEDMAECDIPDLWELIEEAAADYPAWQTTAHTAMERFLTVATSQSRPGPVLVDVLARFARNLDPAWSPPARTRDPAYRTRQTSNADYVRLLADVISRYPLRRRADGEHRDDVVGGDAACLPADFVLPDPAMAALVSVLFDLPAGRPSVEAVRGLRLSR